MNTTRDNYTSFHPDYLETGFSESEYDILNANGLLNSVLSKSPENVFYQLQRNQYRIYEKPYAMWTPYCQENIRTTQDVASDIAKQHEINKHIKTLFFGACGWLGAFIVLLLVLHNRKENY